MTGKMRQIILRKQDYEFAEQIAKWVRTPTQISKFLNLNREQFNHLITGIICDSCKADFNQPCKTRNGGPARIHRARIFTLFAIINACENEYTIEEEQNIEDYL